jgi:hypothetical protein
MNRWQLFFAGIVLGTLCACAAQQGVTTTPDTTPAVKKTPSIQGTDLPCAESNRTDSLVIRYLSENIYRSGAVLPKQEGLACLEELTNWLKRVPQSRWQVTVAGEEGQGFNPLALAAKRQELLQRFFAHRGLEQKDWEWQTVVGQGEQLELRAAP